MSKRIKIWIALCGIVLLGIGWLCGYFTTQSTINAKIKTARNELFVAAYYQIDSLNKQLDMHKGLIVNLASKIDSLQKQKPQVKPTYLALAASSINNSAKNRTSGKQVQDNSVFLDTDADLEFFNTYIENEKDFNF